MNPRSADPMNLQELFDAEPGTWVCDMHDGLPDEIRLHAHSVNVRVPAEIVTTLLESYHKDGMWDEGSSPLVPRGVVNKIAYKVAQDDRVITLAYLYDGVGNITSIEI